jgi:preprotein translocase subunit YajC
MELLFPLALLVLMWFLLIRPQQQRVRAQRELVAALSVGDRVVTVGGLLGRIVALRDDDVDIEAAPGVVLTFRRAAISGVVDTTIEGAG